MRIIGYLKRDEAMSRFVTANRDTAYLLPPSVDEWLPQEHLARYVVEVVEALAFRYLAGNTHPDHDTLATFRKRFLGELNKRVVTLAQIAAKRSPLCRTCPW